MIVKNPLETRILSRAELIASGGEAFARALRMAKPLTVMVLDIDFFKTVNDTWGRPVGDEVLRTLSEICDQKMRKRDLVGRYGGDEYGFVLVDTACEGAVVVADRLRRTISTRAFLLPESVNAPNENPLHVTVSIGLVDLSAGGSSLPEMFEQAEKALATAKKNGRNRVEVFCL